jgi:hypothetical protein
LAATTGASTFGTAIWDTLAGWEHAAKTNSASAESAKRSVGKYSSETNFFDAILFI